MTSKEAGDVRVVYTTEHGRMCPACGRPISQCSCGGRKAGAQGDGIVRVGRETKGRKGKGVTVITGVPLNQHGLESLAAELKRSCGAGGTVKDRRIEIQGDHRETLMVELRARGYTVKRSGG